MGPQSHPSSNTPCLQCKTIDPHNAISTGEALKAAKWFDKYPDFPALKASALNGCQFCRLLRHAMLHEYSDAEIEKAESDFDESVQSEWPTSRWNGNVEIYGGCFRTEEVSAGEKAKLDAQPFRPIRNISFNVWPYPPRRHHEESARWDSHRIWFNLYTQPDSTTQGPVRRTLPCADALSNTNVKAVKSWLDVCSKEHACCQNNPGRLPTRVVDVGPPDGSQPPKLIITAGEPSPYVALSHCWGKPAASQVPRNARTLSANIRAMKSAVPLDSMPRNFQDAIIVARTLGFRYIWIDALCIIQDSSEDWAKEAARMDEYYGSAHLTLAATSAESSIDGFLARPPWPWMTIGIPYPASEKEEDEEDEEGKDNSSREPSSSSSLIHYRYQPDYSKSSRLEAIDRSTWNTRGWTFQERLLSNRILHFTSGRLFWECRAGEGSEEHEPPRDRVYHTTWMATTRKAGEARTKPEPSQLEMYPHVAGVDNRYEWWYELVKKYSHRALSYPADILPALSGLARAFRTAYTSPEDAYLAGLWRADILRGLLWMAKDPALTARPAAYRAPSWSWASVTGSDLDWPSRTVPRHCHYNYTAEVLHAEVTNGGLDEMGVVVGGVVELRGRYRRVEKVVRPAERGALGRFPWDLVVLGASPDGSGGGREEGEGEEEATAAEEVAADEEAEGKGGQDLIIGNAAFDTDREAAAQAHDLYILQIEIQAPGDSFFPYHPCGLLLRRAEDGDGTATFARVGCFALDEESIGFFDGIEPREISLV